MVHQLLRIFELLAVAAAISSIAYYVTCLWGVSSFLRTAKLADKNVRPTPAVSILKPLKGTDPHMYECFRSHCLQDYPEYEIIFGVSDPRDPAIELVERLTREFPQRVIRLTVCRQTLGTNIKVSNLAQMLPEARYEHLIVNDSDIRVEPDYLRRVLAPLADPAIGLVTCLYRGIPSDTLGSRLESLGISMDFCPGVLVARQIEGIKFGLGSTLAFRRRDLQAIGGFETLADYLADDYQLGQHIAALGLKVELSGVVVETFLPRYTLSEFFSHQLRWARAVRDSRFWGYVGMGITFGIPWALGALICARGAVWAWELFAITVAMRVAAAVVVGMTVLGDRRVTRFLAMLPLRDFIAMLVWITSFAGHKVEWRGELFRLKDGKLESIP
ncbi:MAG: bacteriohopanetetrol glucosamine biosynthesis glycosyltransferase HpnI [Acidobacteriia bacterium]|nr:bacteriohopanetetrol glucosamine biosynthesis glycosyltransferase HpnI [Terriglobia bacterium]